MFENLFQSLHESIKRRNTPDSYIPPKTPSDKDVVHRGYLKSTSYPIRYDYIPDEKTSNSGSHIYSFKDGANSGIVEIVHRYSPKMSGHETISKINFEMNEGKPEEYINLYRGAILPSVLHHIKSHGPDILHFSRSVKYADDILRRIKKDFDMIEKESPDGKIVLGKRKLDPKFSRITSYIKKRINTSKES